jgi:hAT family C-terminal dimerisation region
MSNNATETISPWTYFTKSKDKLSGICTVKQCNKVIKAVHGSSSGLRAHLLTQHGINLQKRTNSDDSSASTSAPKTKKNKITSYFPSSTKDKSMEAIISRLVARDGVPFEKFITSDDLRDLFSNSTKKMELPKCGKSIKKTVMDYYAKKKSEVCRDLESKQAQGMRFSLTFDEWTSLRNRRFMNINVHCEIEFFNIGLVRIFGSMPATKCVELLKEKLADFGIRLDQIVGMTTDGASVMVKVGKLVDALHQLCFAHGLQLAVVDVLYKKKTKLNRFGISDVDSNDENCDIELEDSDCDGGVDDTDDIDIDDSEEGAVGFRLTIDAKEEFDLNSRINPLVTKIRSVVKLFRRSPTKNDDLLQKYVAQEHNRNLELILDVKTRWSSLYEMLARFGELQNCVRKALIDLKSDIQFDDEEIALLGEITNALHPIKLAVEKLCSRDMNLYTADITLNFMLDELSAQNSPLSNALKIKMVERIKQRRTTNSDLFQYLSNSDQVYNHDHGIFNKKLSKTELAKAISNLVTRLMSENTEETTDDIEVLQEESQPIPSVNLSLKERLNFAIKQQKQIMPTEKSSPKELLKTIKREMEYFETIKERGKYLKLAYNYLATIQPTSVESERSFSAAGLICSKIRSRMNDDTLDAISFLRAYFLKQ